jgi:ankyrin repeat protein
MINSVPKALVIGLGILCTTGCSPRPAFWNTFYKGDHEDFYSSRLIVAASNGEVEKVRSLLKTMPNPDAERGEWGSTALSRAVMNKHYDVIQVLLDAGADPNLKAYQGTPLSIAVWAGDAQAFDLLREKGSLKGQEEGWSLLHCLCSANNISEANAVPILKALISAGVNINTPNPSGELPLQSLITRKRSIFAQILLSHGADPYQKNPNGNDALSAVQEQIDFHTKLLARLRLDSNASNESIQATVRDIEIFE